MMPFTIPKSCGVRDYSCVAITPGTLYILYLVGTKHQMRCYQPPLPLVFRRFSKDAMQFPLSSNEREGKLKINGVGSRRLSAGGGGGGGCF